MHGGRCIVSDMTCSSNPLAQHIHSNTSIDVIRYEHHIPHVRWHLKNYKTHWLYIFIELSQTYFFIYLFIYIICDPIWENHTLFWTNSYLQHSLFGHFTQEANEIWYPGTAVNAPPRYKISIVKVRVLICTTSVVFPN